MLLFACPLIINFLVVYSIVWVEYFQLVLSVVFTKPCVKTTLSQTTPLQTQSQELALACGTPGSRAGYLLP